MAEVGMTPITPDLAAKVYRGVGMLVVKTSRGELQANSGDLILETSEGLNVMTPQTAVALFGQSVIDWIEGNLEERIRERLNPPVVEPPIVLPPGPDPKRPPIFMPDSSRERLKLSELDLIPTEIGGNATGDPREDLPAGIEKDRRMPKAGVPEKLPPGGDRRRHPIFGSSGKPRPTQLPAGVEKDRRIRRPDLPTQLPAGVGGDRRHPEKPEHPAKPEHPIGGPPGQPHPDNTLPDEKPSVNPPGKPEPKPEPKK